MTRAVLFSAVKNEGPTLVEWVAYHRLIGFDAIYVASNDCSDGSDALLDAMQQQGLIDAHLPHIPDPKFGPQRSAIHAFKASGLLQDGDWFLFLDGDEYLNVHLGSGRVQDLIRKIGKRKSMTIPWRLFGDGGTTGVIERQVCERFIGAEPLPASVEIHVKSLFRYEEGVLDFVYGNMHRPHIKEVGRYSYEDFILAGPSKWDQGSKVNQRWMAGKNSAGTAYIAASEFAADYAQINHYSVRNKDMYRLKQKRGRGYYRKKATDAKVPVRHNDKFYETHNRNDVEDRSILRHQAALDELYERYMAMPDIGSLQKETVTRVSESISAPDEGVAEDAFSPSRVKLNSTDDELFLPKITLPEAEAHFLVAHYNKAKTILEYGAGGSTVHAATLKHRPKVFTIESDEIWSERLSTSIAKTYPQADVDVRYVNIGQTKSWGRPKWAAGYLNYPDYSFGIYDAPEFIEPDLILIDGRFRRGCFYAALFRMTKPVTILWDDYTKRKRYHDVERFVKPAETVGRMARFEIEPMQVPANEIMPIIKAIMDVE